MKQENERPEEVKKQQVLKKKSEEIIQNSDNKQKRLEGETRIQRKFSPANGGDSRGNKG